MPWSLWHAPSLLQPIFPSLSVLSFQIYARLLSSHLSLLLVLHCAFVCDWSLSIAAVLLVIVLNTPMQFVASGKPSGSPSAFTVCGDPHSQSVPLLCYSLCCALLSLTVIYTGCIQPEVLKSKRILFLDLLYA